MPRFSYSRWDGTQQVYDFDADDVFAELTDELLMHGDLNQALQRLLQRGFTDRNGRHIEGLREIMERLRERRRELLEQNQVGGPYEELAEKLRDILDKERTGIDELVEEARNSGDQRRQEITDEVAAERRMALDLLPPDLAGQVGELQNYEWTSSEAREAFDELLDQMRSEMMQSYFNQMSDAMSDVSPESLQRTKDMFNELNRMLEARNQGQDTDRMFAEFMDRFGDMFPGNPESLDELLEQMAQQMAAMQQLLNSMTPEQREQLQRLSDQLLEDMDLRWQVERLSANLRSAFPQAGWERSFDFGQGQGQGQGQDPLGFAQAAALMNELGDLDRMEQMMAGASNPGALADVDVERAGELLGDDAARSLEQLAKMARQLADARLMDTKEGRLELTPRGLRQIGQNALSDLFSKLVKDRMGKHVADRVGIGHERNFETKPYEWGDPFNLSIEKTVRNALGRVGSGTPVRLSPEDFEIERTESLTSTATVLAVDLSLSMPMRGNFLAAKKVAMALHALITSQFPRDYLGLVGFGELARELRPAELPEVSWDYTYGTNMQHALMLARRMLGRQTGTRQIILITDGEPTAHVGPGGEPYFNYPPAPETVKLTVDEVVRCTRAGIRINTFMLDATGYLQNFVEKITRINSGRAFYTTPETLGDYVLVDFLEHRTSRRRPA